MSWGWVGGEGMAGVGGGQGGGEGVKSLSAAMCSAGLSGYVLPGRSSTLGCVNSGAGTFSCQAPLPVDQRTWPSVTVSLSGAKCSRRSANRLWSFAEKWAGNGSAGLGYNLPQRSQQPWRRSIRSQIASNGSNGDLHVRRGCQSLTFLLLLFRILFNTGHRHPNAWKMWYDFFFCSRRLRKVKKYMWMLLYVQRGFHGREFWANAVDENLVFLNHPFAIHKTLCKHFAHVQIIFVMCISNYLFDSSGHYSSPTKKTKQPKIYYAT